MQDNSPALAITKGKGTKNDLSIYPSQLSGLTTLPSLLFFLLLLTLGRCDAGGQRAPPSGSSFNDSSKSYRGRLPGRTEAAGASDGCGTAETCGETWRNPRASPTRPDLTTKG